MASSNENSQTYPSKVDWWIGLLVFASLGSTLFLSIYLLQEDLPSALICLASSVFTFFLIAALAFPCRYSLNEDHLLIQSGLMKDKVMYREISHIELSSNPLSAPAWSLKRIKIVVQHGYKLISPINRQQFIEELKRRIESV